MIITVEPKAKPCPGVKRAISLTEDVLRRGESLYAVGQLIHNEREIDRLTEMGLRQSTLDELKTLKASGSLMDAQFLVRTHGEPFEVIQSVRKLGMPIVDATCSIVRHSQELVKQHVREGYGIIIVGNSKHAEVKGLMGRTKGYGVVISRPEDLETNDFEDRNLLLAQTTVDPDFFKDVGRALSGRLAGLKIVDTTCRFIGNRQVDIRSFARKNDVLLVVGGEQSSNCELLHATAQEVNKRTYKVAAPEDVNITWLRNAERIGITGGASTPGWQLDEMRAFLENHTTEKNPKGLKNRKGGLRSWWKWTNKN